MLRKTEFEHLQTELESMTELLSNLVARRRLRASKSQIALATDAARAKRTEFEALLHAWAVQDEQEVQRSKHLHKQKPSSIMDKFRNFHFSENIHAQRSNARRNAPERLASSRQRLRGPFIESSPLSNPVDREEDNSDVNRLLATLNTVFKMESRDARRDEGTFTNFTKLFNSDGFIGQVSESGEGEEGDAMDPDEELFLAFRLEEEEQINKAILESLREVPQADVHSRNAQSEGNRVSTSTNSENASSGISQQEAVSAGNASGRHMDMDTDSKVRI